MKTSELQYDLPPELIAQRPLARRDEARLLVLHRAENRIEHHGFHELPKFLGPRDCLVLNTSRVLPARFRVKRATGGRIAGLFIAEDGRGRWRVLLTGAGRVREGEALDFVGGPWRMTVLRHGDRGSCDVSIDPTDEAEAVLRQVGAMPLPPYIRRTGEDAHVDALDREFYQTVYAAEAGSVAAPTAGLHFTTELLESIRAAGVAIARTVLHVGLGTFQPIEVTDLAQHVMHRERYSLAVADAGRITAARAAGGRAVAVGTTTVRVLETCYREGALQAEEGWTDILIYPPYSFRSVDALVTNFHLPGSTLLALAFAFAGRDAVLAAYRLAIAERYRFYSYGDAMLIL